MKSFIIRRLFPCAVCAAVLVGYSEKSTAAHPKIDTKAGWKSIFNGKDLTGWACPKGSWAVENGVIARRGGGFLTSVDKYGDFILDLEFKLAPKSNSGVLLRHNPPKDPKKTYWWDGLLEVQIIDSYGKAAPDKHDCGAMYDMIAPSVNTVKRPGKWNRATIVARGSRMIVIMNDKKIVDIDLDDWTEAGKNPDGTPNKYHKAMKDIPRRGFILLQDHGDPVWYRNIFIKPLDKKATK